MPSPNSNLQPEDAFQPGLLSRLPDEPRRVVLLRASRIGDFLCAVPALRALRAALPTAHIAMITLPLLRDLVERSPYLDEFIPFPGFPGIAEQFFDAGQAVAFFQEMQGRHFDLAIQMQGSGVYSNPFLLLLGARNTAGFIRPRDTPGLLNAALPLPETGHEVQRVLSLPAFLGAPSQGEWIDFPLHDPDHAAAQKLLSGAQRPLIGVHPAARDRTRRWPLERFGAAAAELRKRYGGSIVLLGEEAEQNAAREIARQIGPPIVDLTGKTGLAVLGAVVSRLALLLTNDSGPAHVAYALGVPTVTVFGGGDPLRYGPLQPGPFRLAAFPVGCRPCPGDHCPIKLHCLMNVYPHEVVAAANEVVDLKRS